MNFYIKKARLCQHLHFLKLFWPFSLEGRVQNFLHLWPYIETIFFVGLFGLALFLFVCGVQFWKLEYIWLGYERVARMSHSKFYEEVQYNKMEEIKNNE